MRSVRSSTKSTRASRPTANAVTCSTANAGRAETCLVASTNQRGARLSGTARRSKNTAHHASSANTATAAAKPPTAMAPSLASALAAIRSVTKPATPAPNTKSDEALSEPTSRRITRSGGTRASCNTGGKPKPSSSVMPTPRPKSAGRTPGAGKAVCTRPESSQTKMLCTAQPMHTPTTLANAPTAANSAK